MEIDDEFKKEFFNINSGFKLDTKEKRGHLYSRIDVDKEIKKMESYDEARKINPDLGWNDFLKSYKG